MEAQLINTPQVGFPLFSSLPPELRDQIWEMAVTPPQNGVNYFSVHHSSTTGVSSNCVEVDSQHELPTQRGPRLLPPSFDPNDSTPLTRSWFNKNPSTYNLPRVAFAYREARAAFSRVVKLLINAPAQATTASTSAGSSVHSRRQLRALTAKQESEIFKIHLLHSQDLMYLKIYGNALPSDVEFLFTGEHDPYLDPLSLLRDQYGHPKNIAIELAPNYCFFAPWDLGVRRLALLALIRSWMSSGISVWIVNKPKQSETIVLDKSYTSRATVYRDTENRNYMAIPIELYEVCFYRSSDRLREVSWLKNHLRNYIDRQWSGTKADEYLSRFGLFGLLYRQEDLNFSDERLAG